MSRNSRNGSRDEMEQIQKGLEAFLEQELREIQNKQDGPQLYDLRAQSEEMEIEDWDSPEHRRLVKEYRKAEKKEKRQRNIGQAAHSGVNQEEPRGKRRKPDSKKSDNKKRKEAYEEESPKRTGKNSLKRKKRKRKLKLKRFVVIALIVICLLMGGFYYVVGSVYDKLNYDEIESLVSEPVKEEGIVNILLIGNDSRQNGEDGRSDAMILVSINSKTKKIHMTSLLRDMYVEIPGYKNNRLNAAYSFGGAELLMETVEQNLDIDVNRYVQVNFEAFANLVDAVGGVQLELTSEEIEYVNGYLVEYNILTNRPQGTDNMDTSVSGLVKLNGPQALAYTRNRFLGTDFGRTERQRKVLEAVIKKLPVAVLTNPKELFDGLMPNLTTNLTKGECYRLGITAAKYVGYDIVQGSLPQEGTYKNATIRDMAVLEVDFEANKQYLRENVYND